MYYNCIHRRRSPFAPPPSCIVRACHPVALDPTSEPATRVQSPPCISIVEIAFSALRSYRECDGFYCAPQPISPISPIYLFSHPVSLHPTSEPATRVQLSPCISIVEIASFALRSYRECDGFYCAPSSLFPLSPLSIIFSKTVCCIIFHFSETYSC